MVDAKAWVRIPRRFPRISLIAAAAAAGCLLLAAPGLISQAAQNQKLQQATDQIKEILARDGLYTRTTKSPNGQYTSVMERKFELTTVNGCQMVVASNVHTHTEMPAQNRVSDRKTTDIYHPDFSVFDPASVTVSDPQPPQPTWEMKGYLVRIAIQAGGPPMKASTRIEQTSEEHDLPPLPNLSVYIASRDQADRLAKAFAQVATACNSTPAH
jgi:hypothetical protein